MPHDSLRVLVADDNHDTVDSLVLLLQLWGYEGVTAYDGAMTVEMARLRRPDVVLLDIGLPGIDGCEVARQLRRLPETARALLVAITGYGQEGDVQRCREAGIDRHFIKPVDPTEVHKVLMQAEEMRRERRQVACLADPT